MNFILNTDILEPTTNNCKIILRKLELIKMLYFIGQNALYIFFFPLTRFNIRTNNFRFFNFNKSKSTNSYNLQLKDNYSSNIIV